MPDERRPAFGQGRGDVTRAADLIDTDPITIGEASRLLRGIVSESALRSEIRKGNLIAYRIGKNLFTTPQAIREMRDKCRVQPNRPDSTSEKTTEPGSSATATATDELAALKASVSALKNGSLNTSLRNTRHDRQGAGKVTPFPSRKS
jgi:hypothetical protein